MKSPRLAVGVLPALACPSVLVGLLTMGCSEPARKDATPAGANPTPAAAPLVSPSPAQEQPAGTALDRPGPTRTANAPGARADHALHVHAPGDEGAHVEGSPQPKGSLEGLDLEGKPRWTCREERAFRAKGAVSFTDDAPSPLTEALNELAKKTAPMSLVLQRKNGELLAALSATRNGAANKEAFLPNKEPSFAPLVLAFGGDPTVTTDAPLERGYVQLFDKKGPVVLELRRLLWKATRGPSCESVEIDVHAIVPFGQYGLTLHLAKGDKTIAELAGEALPPEGADEAPLEVGEPRLRRSPLSVHFTFPAVATAFEGGAR